MIPLADYTPVTLGVSGFPCVVFAVSVSIVTLASRTEAKGRISAGHVREKA